MNFLSYDSKFGRIFTKFFDGCYLNLLWFVCSIPIFTLGAASAALWSVTLKIAKDEESSSITRMFFRAFKENFRQGTVLWLILLAVGLLLAGDGYILYHLRASASGTLAIFWTLLLAVLIVGVIAYVIILFYIFPLIASVSNTNFAMLKFSFLIGIRYLFCTILMFGVYFAMFFIIVRVFSPAVIFGQGMCAMIISHFLYKIIDECSYVPEEDEEAGGE